MRSHADDRINKGGTVLDLFSLSCIGIITGPCLWCKIQHSRIKSCSAACAGFKEDVRESLCQSCIQLIYTKDIFMHSLALICCRCAAAKRLGHVAVHIPFNVGNGRFLDNLGDGIINKIYNLRSGKIKNVLMS